MSHVIRNTSLPIRQTSTSLSAQNAVYDKGQIIQETDTGVTKLGDGLTAYNSLGFYEVPEEYTPATAAVANSYTTDYKLNSIDGYFTGLRLRVYFNTANTGAASFNLNSFGSKNLYKNLDEPLVSGDIRANSIHELVYDGNAFQIITLSPYLVNIYMKNGDQSTTSNLAANITDLVYSVSASSIYSFHGFIHTGCSGLGGVKIAITLPTGATMWFNLHGFTSATTLHVTTVCITSGTLSTAFNTVASANGGVNIAGTVTVAGTAGNVQFQFASGTNLQTSTIYKEGTFLRIQKIA